MSSELKVDTISEKTSTNGVVVDGVTIKDGAIASSFISGLSSGLSQADEWLLTASHTGDGAITNTYARRANDGFGYIGSGMSVSSGVFTFPATGYYLVIVTAEAKIVSADYNLYLQVTLDDSSYSSVARMSMYDSSGTNYLNMGTNIILDVTDTSQVKCRLLTANTHSNATIYGSTQRRTGLTFIKLGDT
tara:strand:- start:662 stop:1231 length:570 start_codon:yes stop_codon:yes gene_type:complete